MTLLPLLALLFAAPVKHVSIYVGPQVRDGFVDVDKGILDSIADIKQELRKNRAIRVVDEERTADLSLYVLSRGIGPPTAGGSSINVPGAVLTFPNGQIVQTPGMSFHIAANSRHVETLLRVGQYARAFVGEDRGQEVWRECAKHIGKDLSVWLAANRERIAAEK